MKRSGFISSRFISQPLAYELHETAVFFRWEVRLNRGAVHSFLLGWLIVDADIGITSVELSPALGFGFEPIGPFRTQRHEEVIRLAVDRWQELISEKVRKAG